MVAVAVGIYLLIGPAIRLYVTETAQSAMRLFNRASYYPLVLLGLVVVRIALGR